MINLLSIDIVLLIPLFVSILCILAMVFDYVNWFTCLMGIVLSIGIAYWVSPMANLIIQPLGNSLWYGYDWGLLSYLAFIIIAFWIMIGTQSLYYLYMTDGKMAVG